MFSDYASQLDPRDRVGKIVRMENLKRWKFEENENFKKSKLRSDLESEIPQNEMNEIWKMTILNGQTGEWCWMKNVPRLKIDKIWKMKIFKWPNWGMIFEANASN